MNLLNKTFIIFLVTASVLLWFVLQVSSILAPFVVALVFSYFLAPLVSFLNRHRVSRTIGTIVAMLLLALFLTVLSLTILPVLYKQVVTLGTMALSHSNEANHAVTQLVENVQSLSPEIKAKIQDSLLGFTSNIMTFFGVMLGKALHSGAAAVNIISLIFITPIVIFYTLRDWDVITLSLKQLVPPKYGKVVGNLANEIHKCLSGFIRGQSLVCLSTGLYYSIALSIVGVDSGLALGAISGMLTFIPYAGALFSGFLCTLVALIQFGSGIMPIVVIAIFISGQFIEGNFLVPRLVGHNVNLHPVWIMFGLMAGGAMFGFIGVLIALPLTAVLGVVIRFALEYYRKSNFYKLTE